MSELKPCPYCGEPFIIFPRGKGEWLRYFVEHNRSCLMYYHFENVVGYTDIDLLTKELNTRPIEDALIAERDALKERCSELEARLDIYNGNKYDVVCIENEKLRKDNSALKTKLGIAIEALEKIYYRGGPPSIEVDKPLSKLEKLDE